MALSEGSDQSVQPLAATREKREFPSYVEELEYLLRHVAFIVKKRGREILNNFDITPPQFNALLELIYHGNLTMGELCSRLYLASSTVTDLVDRMEKNGLVARERDPEDRRVIRLRVLEAGHRLVDAVMEARISYLRSILRGIEPTEREQLIRALRHIHQLMIEADVQ